MTRVILTNKQTGQELPEAELVDRSSVVFGIQFDGAAHPNAFYFDEWDYREVRAFRNGDVLRRKDRSEDFVFYVYTGDGWTPVDGGCAGVSSFRTTVENPRSLNNPEWELV